MLIDGFAAGLADHSFISRSSVKPRKAEAADVSGCMKSESWADDPVVITGEIKVPVTGKEGSEEGVKSTPSGATMKRCRCLLRTLSIEAE
jgi:hypothetical protein